MDHRPVVGVGYDDGVLAIGIDRHVVLDAAPLPFEGLAALLPFAKRSCCSAVTRRASGVTGTSGRFRSPMTCPTDASTNSETKD